MSTQRIVFFPDCHKIQHFAMANRDFAVALFEKSSRSCSSRLWFYCGARLNVVPWLPTWYFNGSRWAPVAGASTVWRAVHRLGWGHKCQHCYQGLAFFPALCVGKRNKSREVEPGTLESMVRPLSLQNHRCARNNVM